MSSTFKNLQHTLSHYNGRVTKNLTIPKLYNKYKTEQDILSNYIKTNKIGFTRCTQPLHPNIIQYGIDLEIFKSIETKNDKTYILLNNSEVKIPIMNQYNFTFDLKNYLYKDKKIKSKYFDNNMIKNDFFFIESVEERFIPSKFRVDIKMVFDNNINIGIEYLEEHHRFDYEYQIRRAAELREKSNIKKWIFVWQDKFLNDEKYKKMVFKKIKQTIKTFEIINNEEKYIIQTLNSYIHNKKFAKLLYTAFNNENKPVLSKDDIVQLLGINESRIETLFDKIHKQINKIDKKETDFEWSDEEEESDIEDIEDDIYFEEINGETLYSNHGLFVILNKVSEKDFDSQDKYIFCLKLQNKIAKCAFESIRKIRYMELNMDKEFLWGYHLDQLKW